MAENKGLLLDTNHGKASIFNLDILVTCKCSKFSLELISIRSLYGAYKLAD